MYLISIRLQHTESIKDITGSPGLSDGGRASNQVVRPLTGRPVLSQRGRASHREAEPLTGRLLLSQNALNLSKILKNNFYFNEILEVKACYAGLLLAPLEGFGQIQGFFSGIKESLFCCFGPF